MKNYDLYKKFIKAKEGTLVLSDEDQAKLDYQKENELNDIIKDNPVAAFEVLPKKEEAKVEFDELKPLDDSEKMSSDYLKDKFFDGSKNSFEKPSPIIAEKKDEEEKEDPKVEKKPKTTSELYHDYLEKYIKLSDEEPKKDGAANWMNAISNILDMRSQATGQPVIKVDPMKTDEDRRKEELERLGKHIELFGKLKGGKDRKIMSTSNGIYSVDPDTEEATLIVGNSLAQDRFNLDKEKFSHAKNRGAINDSKFYIEEDRKNRALGLSKQKWEAPSDKQVGELLTMEKAISLLDQAEREKEGVDTGKYRAKVEDAKAYALEGEQDPKFEQLRQTTGLLSFDYIKSISGAQYSEKELEDLRKNIPTIYDDDNIFITKLNNLRNIMKAAKNRYEAAINKQKGKEEVSKKNEVKLPKGFVPRNKQ